VDDAGFASIKDSALRASEWTNLGELTTSSAVLAYPGVLSDAQKQEHIAPLAKNGSALAKELGLLDHAGLAALDGHMRFTGKESPAAQLLGWASHMAALTEHKENRADLDKDAIVLEMLKNSGVVPFTDKDGKAFHKPASVNPALVNTFGPVIDDVIATLRH
jgi:hypothetical protein